MPGLRSSTRRWPTSEGQFDEVDRAGARDPQPGGLRISLRAPLAGRDTALPRLQRLRDCELQSLRGDIWNTHRGLRDGDLRGDTHRRPLPYEGGQPELAL